MPHILPIKELRNTNKISELAHKEQEPISLDDAISNPYSFPPNRTYHQEVVSMIYHDQ